MISVGGLVVCGMFRCPTRAAYGPDAAWRGGAFVTGIALAVGWTPCVGYVLGAILAMAASRTERSLGIVLLLVYSAGLG